MEGKKEGKKEGRNERDKERRQTTTKRGSNEKVRKSRPESNDVLTLRSPDKLHGAKQITFASFKPATYQYAERSTPPFPVPIPI